MAAVERHGKEACQRRLSRPACAAKEVGLGDAPKSHGMLERGDSCLLTNYITKFFRSVAPGKNLILHGRASIEFYENGVIHYSVRIWMKWTEEENPLSKMT